MTVYGLSGSQWRQVLASMGGWLMDGYTSMAYALMAAFVISPLFFPSSLPSYVDLFFTYLGFVWGGLGRAFGSAILGNFIGDRLGRKTMLVVTIVGFSLIAASFGILPTYSQASLLAPVLLYIVLFVQGMFAGAEYGGGTALSMESIPPERRNFIGSFVQSGFGMGFTLIAIAFLVFYYFLGQVNMVTYGWRLVFATSLIPGVATLLVRRGAKETSVFEDMKKKEKVEKVPIGAMIREAPGPIIVGLILISGLLYVNAATFNFYPSVMYLTGETIYVLVFVVMAINLMSLAGVLSGGAIASKIGGRKKPMLVYSIAFTATIYPLIILGLSHSGDYLYAMIFFGIQAVLEAMIFATIPAFLAESFSKRFRATAVSFTYNAGGIAAGFALPIIAAGSSVFGRTNWWLINLFVASLVMIAGILLSKETYSKTRDAIVE